MIYGIIDRAFRRQRNEVRSPLAEVGVTKSQKYASSHGGGFVLQDCMPEFTLPLRRRITVGKQQVGRAELSAADGDVESAGAICWQRTELPQSKSRFVLTRRIYSDRAISELSTSLWIWKAIVVVRLIRF